jgi:hypothetical protein
VIRWLVLADSKILLSCLATASVSGSRVAIPGETPGCLSEAPANGGFAFRTHRFSLAV